MRSFILLLLLTLANASLGQKILDKNLSLGGAWQLYEYNADRDTTILLIGNSISFGYRGHVAEQLKDYRILAWPNPYHIKSPELFREMRKVMEGEEIFLVHFNIGLHGWEKGRVKDVEYDSLMQNYVDSLMTLSRAERFIWASTTPITSGERPITLHKRLNPIITRRNKKAIAIMRKEGILVNDLYTYCTANLQHALEDRLHWKAGIYRDMGHIVAAKIRNTMNPIAPNNFRYYVALDGNDSNTGSKDSPFASIEQARNMIRIQRRSGDQNSYKIILREGVYELRQTVEFNAAEYDITVVPYKDERVELSGGLRLDFEKINSISKPIKDDRVNQSISDQIAAIDLSALDIENYGELQKLGFSAPYTSKWMELFVNGKPYQLARWPNTTTRGIGDIIRPGRNADNEGGIFKFSDKRPTQWQPVNDIWIAGYFNHGYADEAVLVDKIDTTNLTISTVHSTHYGFAPSSQKPLRRWYAYNILEELDTLGEYYVDQTKELLYFYKPDTSISYIDLSIMDKPLIAVEGSRNIKIKGLKISNGRHIGISMDNTENCDIVNCEIFNMGSVGIAIGKGVDGWPFEVASRKLGHIANARYSNTIINTEGGKNNGVVRCHIHDTGAGGIYLSGGDRTTLEGAGNFVRNCTIHDFNRLEKTYRPGIDISGVGNRVVSNLIYNAPNMGVQLTGNDHLIQFNEIHNVCTEIDDQGAIYFGRDPSERGNVIKYNYIHHIQDKYLTAGVYHDDGACGTLVYGNIFYEAGKLPSLIGGGTDNTYVNNLFISSDFAIHIDDRLLNWSAKSLKKGGVYQKRLNAVNHNQPPYSESYPLLANYWDDNPAVPKRNEVQSNIFVDVIRVIRGNPRYLVYGNDNLQYGEVWEEWKQKMEEGLYIPNPDELKRPNNWKEIPIEKIGPQ